MKRPRFNPFYQEVNYITIIDCRESVKWCFAQAETHFPNTYQRIKSICSPAKVGLVVTDLITSLVVSWMGWETPPQHRGSAVILCMTSSEVSGAGGGPSYLFFGKY